MVVVVCTLNSLGLIYNWDPRRTATVLTSTMAVITRMAVSRRGTVRHISMFPTTVSRLSVRRFIPTNRLILTAVDTAYHRLAFRRRRVGSLAYRIRRRLTNSVRRDTDLPQDRG